MINLIGLCHSIKNQFPNPVKGSLIKEAILKYLGEEPSADNKFDLIKVLSASWKRNGWSWSDNGAVKLEDDEDVIFHKAGLTLIKTGGDIPQGKVAVKAVHYDQSHPRVIWFK